MFYFLFPKFIFEKRIGADFIVVDDSLDKRNSILEHSYDVCQFDILRPRRNFKV